MFFRYGKNCTCPIDQEIINRSKVRFFASYTTALLELSWLQPAVNFILNISIIFKNVKCFFKVKNVFFEVDTMKMYSSI